jgi:hypothetical protein
MIVGTILLTENDEYVCGDKLPERPLWDKELLKSVISGGTVSPIGYLMLPLSLQALVSIAQDEPTTPITIKEIDSLSDLLIVSRTRSMCPNGKVFRFDNFELIVKDERIEIWKRISSKE